MTWFSRVTKRIAVMCAAVFAAHFVWAVPVKAQTVTFTSQDNSIVVSGRFVAFDGDIVTLDTDRGAMSFRSDGMTCSGETCPDFDGYVPQLHIAGPARVVDALLPALIEVYANDRAWQSRRMADRYEVGPLGETPALVFKLNAMSIDDAIQRFVDLDVDAVLSTRELRPSEVEAARLAGLGRVDRARQARIVALDALVPVNSGRGDRTSISVSDLVAALSMPVPAEPVVLTHEIQGLLQGFEDRFMRPSAASVSDDVTRLDSLGEATDALLKSDDGLSLFPFGQVGRSHPLALDGACGLTSEATYLTLKTEDYPLTFPVYLNLPERRQHPEIDTFLNWIRSGAAQSVIRRSGFVDLGPVEIPVSAQGDRLANAISNAGPEVTLGELQRMVRVLGSKVRMSSTFRFEPGSTRLDGQSRSNVMQLAQSIRDGRFVGSRLMFVGFSDGRGPALANRDLSSARAEAVRRAVEAALGGDIPWGVTLTTEAFGEALPMACDDSVWGQQTNRRVELWVEAAD